MKKSKTDRQKYANVEVNALCLECGHSRLATLATFWNSPGSDERDLRCDVCARTTAHGRVWKQPAASRGRDWREDANGRSAAGLSDTLNKLEASEVMLATLGVTLTYCSLEPGVAAWMLWERGPAGDWWRLEVDKDLSFDKRCQVLGKAWTALLPCNNRDWLEMEWARDADQPDLWRRAMHWRRSQFAS